MRGARRAIGHRQAEGLAAGGELSVVDGDRDLGRQLAGSETRLLISRATKSPLLLLNEPLLLWSWVET